MKYRISNYYGKGFDINESVEGETIETKVERIMTNNEAIEDGAPVIYTERADGVLPEHDIRTDRFDLALDATGAIERSNTIKRMKGIAEREGKIYDIKTGKNIDKPKAEGEH